MEQDRILVTRSSMPPLQEYVDEITPLWESHWLTNMGVKHKQLESELRSRLQVNNIALFTNGHSALECVLEAMQLQGEVITTPFTFASTTHAIKRKGLTPVFADIKPVDYTLDPSSIRKLITPRTCAIVPVHVYGNLCDVDAIQQIADEHGLKVIYDAAHAFGIERDGASAASFGDASMFSFHATKVFNTIEGGAVCLRDSKLYNTLNQWKNFGITGPEAVEYVGGNAKMNEFCAAMGICNLRHLDEGIAKRRAVAERYWENFSDASGIRLCLPPNNVKHNYAYLPVVFTDEFGATRDDVFKALAERGIGARKYFYPLISDYECYRSVYASERTPVAANIAERVLTLPMYADLALADVDRICGTVLSCGKVG
ncbi:DegT/DnrJ/EryC1/StrS family aminotransferase [Paraeggerthella hongkongensis]|uniref:Aminotransferase n=1 Tax=Paraeggerthella hongkongensis TaxID=230658 RepID=A0A3N0BDY0_9ACTN|nr:DegT/DnrJ/EryC1/StrS family aminotransferase [Paraeggerthella hongkongensis]RNL45776.1 aminotransferase [Paraeggerthella hongkongensis]